MFRRHSNQQESGAEKVHVPERLVALSDMQGDAFICDVQIMLRSTVVDDESGDHHHRDHDKHRDHQRLDCCKSWWDRVQR